MLRARSLSGSVVNGARTVFEELARNFEAFGEVLRSIADRFQANAALTSDAGVVKVYERWLKTGSNQLAAALGLQGLVPVRGSGDLVEAKARVGERTPSVAAYARALLRARARTGRRPLRRAG